MRRVVFFLLTLAAAAVIAASGMMGVGSLMSPSQSGSSAPSTFYLTNDAGVFLTNDAGTNRITTQ